MSTQNSRSTSQDGAVRHRLALPIGVHTEEVTGSIPVSPTTTEGP
ncbi:MAG TPA: hypothetical protein VLJ88_06555 [Propionibacteriaceae bacterium]|nr:hypothetical protein [Propionibacteriaceae bacterium]